MFINAMRSRLQCASAAWVTIPCYCGYGIKQTQQQMHLNDKKMSHYYVSGELRAFCCNVHRLKAGHKKNTLTNGNKQWGVGKLIGTFTSWASRLLGPEATITLSCLVARRDNLESMQVCACVFKWWRPQALTQLTVQCKKGTGQWLTRLNQSMKGRAAAPSQINVWFAFACLLSILSA